MTTLLRYLQYAITFCTLALLITACGRDRVTPTPIPASVVRPVQPTPVYGQSRIFRLETPQGEALLITPAPVAPATPPALPPLTPVPSQPMLPIAQNPSALGIATGGATLLDQPGGSALVGLPAGATVTVTGKAADGRYLAAYVDDGQAGWISASQLTLFGGDDLIVVTESLGPGPVATLLAEAMQPVRVLDQLVVTPTATPSRTE